VRCHDVLLGFIAVSSPIFLVLFVPSLTSIHLILLGFLPCLNLLGLLSNKYELHLKLLENKMQPFEAPSDLDSYKMGSIETDFQIYAVDICLRILHFFALIYVRGFNFNSFDILILGRATMSSFKKMLSDLSTYFEYRLFLSNLDNLMVKKHFGEENQEICPICQESMQSAR